MILFPLAYAENMEGPETSHNVSGVKNDRGLVRSLLNVRAGLGTARLPRGKEPREDPTESESERGGFPAPRRKASCPQACPSTFYSNGPLHSQISHSKTAKEIPPWPFYWLLFAVGFLNRNLLMWILFLYPFNIFLHIRMVT